MSGPERFFYERGRFDTWQQWLRHDFAGASVLDRAREHPAFEAIVRMGDSVVPSLLGDLEDRGDRITLMLLRAVVSQDENAPRGRFADYEMERKAWLMWGNITGKYSSREPD